MLLDDIVRIEEILFNLDNALERTELELSFLARMRKQLTDNKNFLKQQGVVISLESYRKLCKDFVSCNGQIKELNTTKARLQKDIAQQERILLKKQKELERAESLGEGNVIIFPKRFIDDTTA